MLALIGYPLLIIAGLEVVLGTMLLRQNPRSSRVNSAVAAFAFFSAAFSLNTALMYIAASAGLDHIRFARFNWIGWCTIPAALQGVYYIRDENDPTARVIGWVLYPFWAVMLALSLFTDLIVTDRYTLLPFSNDPGPVENPARFAGAMLLLWLMAELVRSRRSMTGIRRAQLNYFFHGTFIFGICAAVTAGFLQLFGGFGFEPGLASYFSLPWVALTFYAISRYRLFDIRIVVSNTLGIVILFALFAGAHAALFRVLEPLSGGTVSLLFSLFIVVLLFFGTPLSTWVRQFVRKTVLRDRYLYQDVLRDSVKAIITILDFSELMAYLAGTIRTSLRSDAVSIYLKGPDGRYLLRHSAGALTAPLPEQPLHPGIAELIQQAGQAAIREELERILPEHAFGDLNRALRSIDAELIIPLRYKGRLEGILTVGSKGNGEPYIQSDIDLLDALAGHAAVAIENARLYDEARRAHDSLRESEARLSAIVEHSIGKYLSR